jgi:pimeloyl-ACP methyl ester carboxylesterase
VVARPEKYHRGGPVIGPLPSRPGAAGRRPPDGRTVDVAVSKLSTARPGKRRGVLVLNPGGPALPGLDMPGTMAPALPASVLDGHDLVGFDPRGVGNSTPQSCGIPDTSPVTLFPYPAADGPRRQAARPSRTGSARNVAASRAAPG